MLEAVHLTKRYASLPAVQDLSFTLRPGQVLGCLGPNGSGKSTTVKMLTGLLQPTRGVVHFDGHNIQDNLPAYRKRLGYVPEEAHLVSLLDRLGISGVDRNSARNAPIRAREEDRFPAANCSRCIPTGTPALVLTRKGMRQRILLHRGDHGQS